MGILSWIVVGYAAGWLTGLFLRGGNFGLPGDIILGIIGGLWGGFLGSALLNVPGAMTNINPITLLIACTGSLLMIFLLRNSGGSLARSSNRLPGQMVGTAVENDKDRSQ